MTLSLPEFSSNSGAGADRRTVGWDVASTLQGIVASGELAGAPKLDVASAYFNAGGYALLADALDGVGPVRLLLGAEPTDAQVRLTITPLTVRAAHKGDPRVSAAVTHHQDALVEDRNLAGFGVEVDRLIERLILWLERGDVEVRRLEKGFLHGKVFILKALGGSALAGSSNFTQAGLSQNRELNVGVHTPTVVGQVREWFEEHWDAAVPYDLAALYRDRRVPHDPYLVFLRMLLELYGSELADQPETDNELGLAQHQLDGVWRAQRILRERGGVIVADEVGLGKTYIAGELIREATIERRQKVLVVAPATLRDATWEPFLDEKNLHAKVVSFEQLVAALDGTASGLPAITSVDDYAMVVVDEAHHIRNAGTARASAMRALLGGKVGKQLVMLSATPVNNSLKDLHNLLGYISTSDSAFADIGVNSLAEYFNRAMALDPDELSGEHLFEVLDAIAVRRTRRFIQTQYPNATLPDGTPMVFPQAKVHRVDYDLSALLPDFFPRFAAALGKGLDKDAPPADGTYLTMARYVPSRYDNIAGDEQYQVQNAGLLQSALLKRFESSSAAFCSTLKVMMKSHDEFLSALDKGWVLTGDALREWVATDSDDVEEFVSNLDEDASDNVSAAGKFDVATLRAHVTADRTLLKSFHDEVATVGAAEDPKVAALADALAAIAKDAGASGIGEQETRDRRKVLLFTYFADTARYVFDAITALTETDSRLADYRGRIALATGSDKVERQVAIMGFAPRTIAPHADLEDRFDLLIATDVLSEGVNLQQAGQIINYDLPWNPMRLVQRHGRVDRIGSQHSHIHMRCFFPDAGLEELLELEARLQLKLKHAAAAFGTDEVLPGMTAVEVVMGETKEEIDKLRREEVSLFDPQRGASASSEEFQRRLAVGLEHRGDAIRALPWGAGTGLVKAGAERGVVFCVKVANHPRPFFRFVPMDVGPGGEWTVRVLPVGDDGSGGGVEIVSAMLTCLNLADPGPKPVVPVLTEPMHRAAFAAWPAAQESVYADWMAKTDPAAIQPKVPAAMHRAAAIVRDHGSFLGDQQDRLVQRFGQVVEARYLTLVRQALADAQSDPKVAVSTLKALADELRLPVPKPIEPYPAILEEDVRVLAWVTVAPGS